MLSYILKKPLWLQVLVASFLAIVFGINFPSQAVHFKIFGTIFINLIKMLTIPLIIFSLISGINAVGSSNRASSLALKSIIAFLLSALSSVILGLIIGTLLSPGYNVKLPNSYNIPSTNQTSETMQFISLIENLFSDNIIYSMASGNILQVIIFTIIISITMVGMHDKCGNLIKICNEASLLIFKLIENIVKLAPIGVFGYLSWSISSQGFEVLLSLLKMVLCIIFACVIQYVLYSIYLIIFAKLNPKHFFKKMLEPQLLAFSTSSSKATLTTTMRVMNEQLGVSKYSTNFVLPIGTSINMNGGAIYLSVATLFFAQAMNIELQVYDYIMLAITCTIGSIGAAGIPSGILLFLGMALNVLHLPSEFVVLVAGVDRILDMFTTTVNVVGDAVITVIIDKNEETLDLKTYNS